MSGKVLRHCVWYAYMLQDLRSLLTGTAAGVGLLDHLACAALSQITEWRWTEANEKQDYKRTCLRFADVLADSYVFCGYHHGRSYQSPP